MSSSNSEARTQTYIAMKSVEDLLNGEGADGGYRFIVPSYQRGYRWGKDEVEALLNDLRQYKKECDNDYCLQPVVVKANGDGAFEVVDGQQRLTTLYIINKVVNQVISGQELPSYSIEYATRPGSADFLRHIQDMAYEDAESMDNPDFYYMVQAAKTVESWMRNDIGSSLQQIGFWERAARHVNIIWYEVAFADDDAHNSIELFRKINIGKIPLTNAELVKGLLISRTPAGKEEERRNIASEWDRMENQLQDDDLWYFLTDRKSRQQYLTRIDLILDIWYAQQPQPSAQRRDDAYAVFNYLYRNMPSDEDAGGNAAERWLQAMWKGCKGIFANLDFWFKDHETYHLLGYLISRRKERREVNELLSLYAKLSACDKSDMKETLREEIGRTLGIREGIPAEDALNRVADLIYDDGIKVRNVLLLFNLLTIVEGRSSIMRFPFKLYEEEHWDLEHIHATAGGPPTDDEIRELDEHMRTMTDVLPAGDTTGGFVGDGGMQHMNDRRKSFMKGVLGLLKESDAESDICDQVENFIDEDDFSEGNTKQFWDQHSEQIGKNMLEQDSIANLTLLNSSVNRGYGNVSFLTKREWISNADRSTLFIPPATKNVFMKYYTKDPDDFTCWGETDRQGYLHGGSGIIEVLRRYLEPLSDDAMNADRNGNEEG